MEKLVKFLSIAFALSVIANVAGVSAYSYQVINNDIPGYMAGEWKSPSLTKVDHGDQMLESVICSRQMQAAIYGADGVKLTPGSWKVFSGNVDLWFEDTNERLSSSERDNTKVRIYIETTSMLGGGHLQGFYFPDPAPYGHTH